MRTIYRVENAEGVGPYRAIQPEDRAPRLTGQATTDHPSPWGDIRGWQNVRQPSYFRFGFVSLDRLTDWFPPDVLAWLREEHGQEVVEVQVEDQHILFGYKQLAYYAPAAEKCRRGINHQGEE